jgi:hypothetical protein
MADLTVQNIDRSGLSPSYGTCAGGGDQFLNASNTFIHVKNGDASPHTVTIVTQSTSDGLAVADRAVAIPAGEERLIGPFPSAIYDDGNGKVQLTYDAVTSMTIAALRLGST